MLLKEQKVENSFGEYESNQGAPFSAQLSCIFIRHPLHCEDPLNLCCLSLCGLWRISSSVVGNCLLSAAYHFSSKKSWGLSSLWNFSTRTRTPCFDFVARLSPPLLLFSVFCLPQFALPVLSFGFSSSAPLRKPKYSLVLWKECLWKSQSDSF